MTGSPSRSPATVKSACALVLGWLAGRDLSSEEIRLRLRRRQCPDEIIGEAIEQLRASGAIDDERVAIGRARVESAGRGRGRERVLLRLRSIGIDADTARRAVDAVFEEIDEDALLERALARRLRSASAQVRGPAEYRRLYDALVRQGFAPGKVRAALDRRRAASADFWQEDSSQ